MYYKHVQNAHVYKGGTIMRQFKCDTVEQYFVYEWIKKNFYVSYLINIEKASSNSLMITDINREQLIVTYENEKISYELV